MTTTSTWQGIDDDAKPSSRVLAPPGGGSSFSIFGPPEPPVTKAAAAPPKAAAGPGNTNNCNNVSGTASTDTTKLENQKTENDASTADLKSLPNLAPQKKMSQVVIETQGDGAHIDKEEITDSSADEISEIVRNEEIVPAKKKGPAGMPTNRGPPETKERIFGDYNPYLCNNTNNKARDGDTQGRLFGDSPKSASYLKQREFAGMTDDTSRQALVETRKCRRTNKEHGRGTYNPITGEAIVAVQGSASDSKALHTSTRVRQPPGGASTKLW